MPARVKGDFQFIGNWNATEMLVGEEMKQLVVQMHLIATISRNTTTPLLYLPCNPGEITKRDIKNKSLLGHQSWVLFKKQKVCQKRKRIYVENGK